MNEPTPVWYPSWYIPIVVFVYTKVNTDTAGNIWLS